MLELQLEIQLEGQINLEMEIQNTEIVVIEGFDYFDINWINPTLSAGTLTANFAFSPSPQEDVTKIELWINGSLAETRMSNDESAFVVENVTDSATIEIRAYNNDLLMAKSEVLTLPVPVAPDIDEFSFQAAKYVDITEYCSDPQGLPIELLSSGVPTNGLVSIIDNTTIAFQPIDDSQPTTVPYTIINSAGNTASGTISVSWEEIVIAITSPTEAQEFTDAEDITVSFEVTPEVQNYISAIGLVVDGVEVEKRTPYSTDDFTIAAGELDVDTHTIVVRAYDANDEVVYNSQAVSVDVVASFIFGNALQFDGQDDFLSPSSGEFGNNLTSFTLSWWWKLQTENFTIGSLPSNSNGWFVYYANGFLRIGVRNSNVGGAIYMLPLPTEWTHFFVVYDGSLAENLRVQLYVDGQFVSIDSFTGNVAAALNATAGNSFVINSVSNLFGEGAIDELIMKKNYIGTAQQAAQIASGADAAQIIPNPDRIYRFNELDPATVTVDEGSEGADLVLNNFTSPSFIPHI